MKLNYYGYYIRDNQKQENYLMDLRDFFRFFCAYKNPAYKNRFKRYTEHVYMLSSTRNLYFFLQTHNSEIVKKINAKDISLGEVADLLSKDESLGFASYVYFDGHYFGFASTVLAPKCRGFVEFVNSIFHSLDLPQHSFCLHPLIRTSTKDEVLSMPFVGTTTIQVSKDNPLYKDLFDFVGGKAEEFADVDSFELVMKPRKRQSIHKAVDRLVTAVQDTDLDKLVIRAKDGLQNSLVDFYLEGKGIIADYITVREPGQVATEISEKIKANPILSAKVKEFLGNEQFKNDPVDVLRNFSTADAWPVAFDALQVRD